MLTGLLLTPEFIRIWREVVGRSFASWKQPFSFKNSFDEGGSHAAHLTDNRVSALAEIRIYVKFAGQLEVRVLALKAEVKSFLWAIKHN